jgi:ribosomal protein S27AE
MVGLIVIKQCVFVEEYIMSEQDLLEQLEVCCPVCGSNSFSHDETNGISCDECDYMELENDNI